MVAPVNGLMGPALLEATTVFVPLLEGPLLPTDPQLGTQFGEAANPLFSLFVSGAPQADGKGEFSNPLWPTPVLLGGDEPKTDDELIGEGFIGGCDDVIGDDPNKDVPVDLPVE